MCYDLIIRFTKSFRNGEVYGNLNEEDLSTQHDQQKEDPRIFAADEHQGGTEDIEAQKG